MTTFTSGTVITSEWLNSVDAAIGGENGIFSFFSDAEIADVEARTRTENVAPKIIAALDSGLKRLKFPAGSYYLGEHTDATKVIDLSSYGDDITFETSADVEFVITSTGTSPGLSNHPRVFFLQGNNNFSCGDCCFTDLGYASTYPGVGGVAFYYESVVADSANLRLGHIYCVNWGVGLQCVKNDAGNIGRLRGISGKITVTGGTYGANFSNLGDDVSLDLVTTDCWRSYYVYGCSNHNVRITNRDPRTGSGQVNIANGVNAAVIPKDTKDITVKYSCRATPGYTIPSLNHVLINCFADSTGTIDGVYLDLNVDDNEHVVWFANYTTSGGVETAAVTSGIVVNNIFITGVSSGGYIGGIARYTTKPYVNIRGLRWYDDFPEAINQTREINFNPVLTPASGSFSIGAGGSLIQRVYASEGFLQVNTQMILGTAPTLGTGAWRISMPYPNKSSIVTMGVGRITHGGNYYDVTLAMGAGDQFFMMTTNASGTNVGDAAPFVWVAGDVLVATITYPI